MKHGRRLLGMGLVVAMSVAVPAVADERQRVDLGREYAAAPTGAAALEPWIDPGLFEYLRVGSNGVYEYGLTPPTWMLGSASGLPRPAFLVAGSFIGRNADALGLLQDPADFRYVRTEVRCDGSEVVTFEQTANSLPVETSYFEVVVRGQAVKHVAARFIREVWQLPVCEPSGSGELRYLPQPASSIVVSGSIEQLTSQEGRRVEAEVLKNACTGAPVSVTIHYR